MVPIKEAISSGAWLHGQYVNFKETFEFRIKINSFRKLLLSEIDNPEEIKEMDYGSILWLMQIEFVNLTKRPVEPSVLRPIILVDQDGFSFNLFEDSHLESNSEFSKTSGMARFCYQELIPKIKAVGAIAFLLPDDDDAEYSISIKNVKYGLNGNIQEV